MNYTIKQVAEKMGVTVSTLRYYDKEGLLPFVDRKPDGTRVFKDEDFHSLEIIKCMKRSGMPIKQIKRYMDLCQEGDKTLQERLNIFLERKKVVLRQMEELNKVMETINHKIWYYETAIAAGTERVHKK
ncbi:MULTISPECIES: MerR family transcriptional regulator [Clostridium]|jgi:DNA-binding transcriptional MerR regulator|uniref:HTH-type transcriptional regulator AdhR n=2 Tax=Clostridium TaxID=1485 RepID=A0A151AMS1_9CLOT|nr:MULTISPECIES: MerR family transcriptional regulator [Clostridium]KYH28697.1 HTH-type transcriptional regulator AdhR [Clostridium colicanis DSM 13634]MBE6044965.1 MerR family transcriptional regulator [Clostridium thermopalmarium]PRR76998.1 HTH-type transcriptional regulator AdhR [Clostridium thermopalmarium DSM 5974]PVZ21193.1 DNA-binding transcriptional MerR regulator [Clostridium thermopalmarium DSM 5974]